MIYIDIGRIEINAMETEKYSRSRMKQMIYIQDACEEDSGYCPGWL